MSVDTVDLRDDLEELLRHVGLEAGDLVDEERLEEIRVDLAAAPGIQDPVRQARQIARLGNQVIGELEIARLRAIDLKKRAALRGLSFALRVGLGLARLTP